MGGGERTPSRNVAAAAVAVGIVNVRRSGPAVVVGTSRRYQRPPAARSGVRGARESERRNPLSHTGTATTTTRTTTAPPPASPRSRPPTPPAVSTSPSHRLDSNISSVFPSGRSSQSTIVARAPSSCVRRVRSLVSRRPSVRGVFGSFELCFLFFFCFLISISFLSPVCRSPLRRRLTFTPTRSYAVPAVPESAAPITAAVVVAGFPDGLSATRGTITAAAVYVAPPRHSRDSARRQRADRDGP